MMPHESLAFFRFFFELVTSNLGPHEQKPDFGTPKMENTLFMGRTKNRPP
jgi:hypothetical protein